MKNTVLNYVVANVMKQKIGHNIEQRASCLFLEITYEIDKVTGEATLRKRKSNGLEIRQY